MTRKASNLLLIVTDQQRKGSVGCYPDADAGVHRHAVHTPNLDALAAEGVVFDTAYTTCPICSPARATLHTGTYPFRHGMQTNIFQRGAMTHELPDGPHLLGRALQAGGYRTGFTGKWHLGYGKQAREDPHYRENYREIDLHLPEPQLPEAYLSATALPSTRGFDLADDFPGHGGGGHHYPQFLDYLKEHGYRHAVQPESNSHGTVDCAEETIDWFLTDRAMSMIDELAGGPAPWAMTLNFWGPHAPSYVPREYFEPWREMSLEPWASFEADQAGKPRIHHAKRQCGAWAEREEYLRHYYAYASFIDQQIGRVFEHLKSTGQWDETIVIFVADHGDSCGIHGGLSDKGLFMYEQTTSIPLIVRPAGGTPARRDDRPVSLADVHATVVDIAGGDASLSEHGRSLLPLVDGSADDWRDAVVSQSDGIGYLLCTTRMIRKGAWKYVFNAGDRDELYDLDDDPNEMTNLAGDADHRVRLADMRDVLDDWMVRNNDRLVVQYRALVQENSPARSAAADGRLSWSRPDATEFRTLGVSSGSTSAHTTIVHGSSEPVTRENQRKWRS